MLPKVATTLLHSSSRAASAVQNQSTAIRNVLQLQSNSGPNSGRGGNGPSSGGFRYSAGSRSYHSSGRAVSQAGLYEANDGAVVQSDDSDEFGVTQAPRRSRRHSTSLTVAERRDQRPLGVLTAVKLHARSRHAFAVDSPVKPRSRRNSLSAVEALPLDDSFLLARPPSPVPQADSFTAPPPSPPREKEEGEKEEAEEEDVDRYHYKQLLAVRSLDATQAAAAVADFRDTVQNPTVQEFNAALDALFYTRPKGEPITLLLATYNDMISRGLVPNVRTYTTLILALTTRDYEGVCQLTDMSQRVQWVGEGIYRLGSSRAEQALIQQIHEENNVGSALSTFRTLSTLDNMGARTTVSSVVFRNLFRMCANHATEPGVVESAVQIWAYMERVSRRRIPFTAFEYMISIYGSLNDIAGAQEVFKEYRLASKQGRVFYSDPAKATEGQLFVWNEMISTAFACGEEHRAVAILDEMLVQPTEGQQLVSEGVFAPRIDASTPPAPSSNTLAAVISGFFQCGDVDSACTWFERLTTMPFGPKGITMNQPTIQVTRPSTRTWQAMIAGLVKHGEIERLQRLIIDHGAAAKADGIELRGVDMGIIFNGIMGHLTLLGKSTIRATREQVQVSLQAISIIEDTFGMRLTTAARFETLALWLVGNGYPEEGVAIFDRAIRYVLTNITSEGFAVRREQGIRMTSQAYTSCGESLPLSAALTLGKLAETLRYTYPVNFTVTLLQIYSRQPAEVLQNMHASDWAVVLSAASCVELMPSSVPSSMQANYGFNGCSSLLEDMVKYSPSGTNVVELVSKAVPTVMNSVLALLIQRDGETSVREKLAAIGYASLIDEVMAARSDAASDGVSSVFDGASVADSTSTSPVIMSPEGTEWRWAGAAEMQELTGMLHYHATDPENLYRYFSTLIERKKLPTFVVARKLVSRLGRAGRGDYVDSVYSVMMQKVPEHGSNGMHAYLQFLDALIPCFASLGQLERAHEMRRMLLEAGSSPSADSYGALIYHVNETTDDATNALAFFYESRARGVRGSPYLYNNIISKVGKARKADLALEMFTGMKAEGVPTSSITYGAVIGACVRVGDAASAEVLFAEMEQQPNFHPRIPPYNTMMQLYTTTKPNKERALHYYTRLREAKITPSSYTHKLLIDAYALDTTDLEKAEKVYRELCQVSKGRKALEGQHVAAMLNAYGCVHKDLPAAIRFFDEASAQLSSSSPSPSGPDAVVFEAMFNVITVHRRPDLIATYLEKMDAAGVRMNAYVVNVVIRAFAVAGEVERAREIFEGLEDPERGVAAVGNHVVHGNGNGGVGGGREVVGRSGPVYREPSTWEAMVRAELGQGHRERALDLLARLKERQYPDAVFNRISGIMVDHSSLPP